MLRFVLGCRNMGKLLLGRAFQRKCCGVAVLFRIGGGGVGSFRPRWRTLSAARAGTGTYFAKGQCSETNKQEPVAVTVGVEFSIAGKEKVKER